jgi:hypothetical protein
MMAPAWAQQADPQAKADPAAAPAQTQTAAPAKAEEKPADNPAPPIENWLTGGVDLGYRWLINQQGNFQEYRSVVNLGQGPKLLGLDFTIQDPKKRLFDRIDARASGWGGDPYNTAHIDVRKQGVYNFTADYRNIAYFNADPSFANPLGAAGFNEQTFDIHRRDTNISLDLFPTHRFVPYLVYNHNSGSGSGIETWVQDSNNEYAVPALFRDSTNNYRGGVHVELNRLHVTLEQGGTTYKDDDQAYDNIQEPGDRTSPLLGQTMFLSGLRQAYGIRGSSLYSKVLLTASPFRWLDIYGQFLYSEPKTTVNFTELTQGNFAELSQLLFYSTQLTIGTGSANQPHTTGNIGFEVRPLKRLRIIESLTTDRSHDAASPFVTEQILAQGVNQTLLTALNYGQVVNYNQQQVDVLYDLTSKLTLRGGYRFIWGDATVLAGELSQTGNLVSGQLHRNVGLAGMTFRATKKLSMNFDYEGASSDHIYFRTSLNDYNKVRARANYQITNSLSAQARFTLLDNQNPDPSIHYDFRSRDNAVSLFWTPDSGKRITIMGEYDRSTLRSDISYLDLFLSPNTSAYRDNAHTATSAIVLAVPGYAAAKLTVGGSLFVSSGSRPSRYYQPLARLSVPIQKNISWNSEWQWYGYGEQFYLFEGFRTHVFMTGLRVNR